MDISRLAMVNDFVHTFSDASVILHQSQLTLSVDPTWPRTLVFLKSIACPFSGDYAHMCQYANFDDFPTWNWPHSSQLHKQTWTVFKWGFNLHQIVFESLFELVWTLEAFLGQLHVASQDCLKTYTAHRCRNGHILNNWNYLPLKVA